MSVRGRKSVKRVERSNGLDNALYKKKVLYLLPFTPLQLCLLIFAYISEIVGNVKFPLGSVPSLYSVIRG